MMYCFGEDFDYNVNVQDLFDDYKKHRGQKNLECQLDYNQCNVFCNKWGNTETRNTICKEARNGWLPWKSGAIADMEEEAEIQKILSPVAAQIYPYAEEAVKKADYIGSPIYEKTMEKEVVTQLVEDTCKAISDDIAIANLENQEPFCQYSWRNEELLKAVIEYMIIKKIYNKRHDCLEK